METCADQYVLHLLDLRPPVEELYRRLHKSSIQRKIRRAEREGLTLEEGRSSSLLAEFFRLHVKTRRRHGLPPHPRSWFEWMLTSLGERFTIRLARKKEQAIAALVTIETNNSFVYKYGASDAKFHEMGGMPFLAWSMIRAGKQAGHSFLDLGRSECANSGLIAFKNHLGAVQHPLVYMRIPAQQGFLQPDGMRLQLTKFAFRWCPDSVLIAAGELLYPHVG
jgi:lipid II:glycine glycyltransferase (peptidoglycan interpeptide bridge formation enzyme)